MPFLFDVPEHQKTRFLMRVSDNYREKIIYKLQMDKQYVCNL